MKERIILIVICLLVFVFSFLLGVATERRMATDRINLEDDMTIEKSIEEEKEKELNQEIDLEKLDFMEELRGKK